MVFTKLIYKICMLYTKLICILINVNIVHMYSLTRIVKILPLQQVFKLVIFFRLITSVYVYRSDFDLLQIFD